MLFVSNLDFTIIQTIYNSQTFHMNTLVTQHLTAILKSFFYDKAHSGNMCSRLLCQL